MNSADVDAIHCSLLVAGAATLVVVPIGTAIALGLVTAQRASRFWQVAGGIGQWLVDFPLVLPPVVTGYALLICFSPNHWPGEFLASCLGLRLLFHWSGAAVAAGVISLPLYVRAAQIGLERIPRSLEEMASLEGAGRWQIFRRISLPIAFPAMTLGTLLAFARCMGEFGATIMVAGNIQGSTQTISLRIYQQMSQPGVGSPSPWMLIAAIATSAIALAIAHALRMRSNKI